MWKPQKSGKLSHFRVLFPGQVAKSSKSKSVTKCHGI